MIKLKQTINVGLLGIKLKIKIKFETKTIQQVLEWKPDTVFH